MMKKRDRLEIIHDILKVIRDKIGIVRPTHILYKSNLSHQMLTDYVHELKEKKLILELRDKKLKKHYQLTDKGYNYLSDYVMIRKFVDSYGLN